MRKPLRTTGWSSASTIVIVSSSTHGTVSLIPGSIGAPAARRIRAMPRRPGGELRMRADGRDVNLIGMSSNEKDTESLMDSTGLGLLPGIAIALGLMILAMALVLTGSMWAVAFVLVLIGACLRGDPLRRGRGQL